MSLFILDRMPVQAARYNCDAHVRKNIMESVEMLGHAFDDGDFKFQNKSGRLLNHPMSIWVRETLQNFDWTLEHSYALCHEFSYRFGKLHKCQEHLDWIAANVPINNLHRRPQTDWPRCFGEYQERVGETDSVVNDYRRYYMLTKRHLATWTKREIPEWYR